jgi:hypothetical protein
MDSNNHPNCHQWGYPINNPLNTDSLANFSSAFPNPLCQVWRHKPAAYFPQTHREDGNAHNPSFQLPLNNGPQQSPPLGPADFCSHAFDHKCPPFVPAQVHPAYQVEQRQFALHAENRNLPMQNTMAQQHFYPMDDYSTLNRKTECCKYDFDKIKMTGTRT